MTFLQLDINSNCTSLWILFMSIPQCNEFLVLYPPFNVLKNGNLSSISANPMHNAWNYGNKTRHPKIDGIVEVNWIKQCTWCLRYRFVKHLPSKSTTFFYAYFYAKGSVLLLLLKCFCMWNPLIWHWMVIFKLNVICDVNKPKKSCNIRCRHEVWVSCKYFMILSTTMIQNIPK